MIKIIIFVIIMFEVLIITHEFGHFYTARKFGVVVKEFAIGMGPAILQKEIKGIKYSLRAFPIGGFVSMEGESMLSKSPGSFGSISTLRKIIVLAAGSIMNLLTGIVIVFIMYLMIGSPTTTIAAVTEDEPAWQAGLQQGDIILSINGEETPDWDSLKKAINSLEGGKAASIEIMREGQETPVLKTVDVRTTEEGVAFIGISPEYRMNLINTFKNTAIGTVNLVYIMYESIRCLITGEVSVKEVVGPVGMVSVVSGAARQGIYYVLYLTALLSVNLGVVNLIPFPALDGGHIVITALDRVLKNGIKPEIITRITYAGFSFLMFIMVIVTVKDISNLFK